VFIVPTVTFLRPDFTICTARSARPLLARFCRTEAICLNVVNASPVKQAALFDNIVSGITN